MKTLTNKLWIALVVAFAVVAIALSVGLTVGLSSSPVASADEVSLCDSFDDLRAKLVSESRFPVIKLTQDISVESTPVKGSDKWTYLSINTLIVKGTHVLDLNGHELYVSDLSCLYKDSKGTFHSIKDYTNPRYKYQNYLFEVGSGAKLSVTDSDRGGSIQFDSRMFAMDDGMPESIERDVFHVLDGGKLRIEGGSIIAGRTKKADGIWCYDTAWGYFGYHTVSLNINGTAITAEDGADVVITGGEITARGRAGSYGAYGSEGEKLLRSAVIDYRGLRAKVRIEGGKLYGLSGAEMFKVPASLKNAVCDIWVTNAYMRTECGFNSAYVDPGRCCLWITYPYARAIGHFNQFPNTTATHNEQETNVSGTQTAYYEDIIRPTSGTSSPNALQTDTVVYPNQNAWLKINLWYDAHYREHANDYIKSCRWDVEARIVEIDGNEEKLVCVSILEDIWPECKVDNSFLGLQTVVEPPKGEVWKEGKTYRMDVRVIQALGGAIKLNSCTFTVRPVADALQFTNQSPRSTGVNTDLGTVAFGSEQLFSFRCQDLPANYTWGYQLKSSITVREPGASQAQSFEGGSRTVTFDKEGVYTIGEVLTLYKGESVVGQKINYFTVKSERNYYSLTGVSRSQVEGSKAKAYISFLDSHDYMLRKAYEGQDVVIRAELSEGAEFVRWEVKDASGNDVYVYAETLTYTEFFMPASNVTVTAIVRPASSLTIDWGGSLGLSIEAYDNAPAGELAVNELLADFDGIGGYTFSHFSLEGSNAIFRAGDTITLSDYPAISNYVLRAHWAEDPYTVVLHFDADNSHSFECYYTEAGDYFDHVRLYTDADVQAIDVAPAGKVLVGWQFRLDCEGRDCYGDGNLYYAGELLQPGAEFRPVVKSTHLDAVWEDAQIISYVELAFGRDGVAIQDYELVVGTNDLTIVAKEGTGFSIEVRNSLGNTVTNLVIPQGTSDDWQGMNYVVFDVILTAAPGYQFNMDTELYDQIAYLVDYDMNEHTADGYAFFCDPFIWEAEDGRSVNTLHLELNFCPSCGDEDDHDWKIYSKAAWCRSEHEEIYRCATCGTFKFVDVDPDLCPDPSTKEGAEAYHRLQYTYAQTHGFTYNCDVYYCLDCGEYYFLNDDDEYVRCYFRSDEEGGEYICADYHDHDLWWVRGKFDEQGNRLPNDYEGECVDLHYVQCINCAYVDPNSYGLHGNENGYGMCEVCGAYEIPCEHQWSDWEQTQAATCQLYDTWHAVCAICGGERVFIGDKLEHHLVLVEARPADCNHTGHEAYYYCLDCHMTFDADVVDLMAAVDPDGWHLRYLDEVFYDELEACGDDYEWLLANNQDYANACACLDAAEAVRLEHQAAVQYTAKDPTNHTGNTVLGDPSKEESDPSYPRSAKANAAGYTGDVYCLDCGALIEEGHEIPAHIHDHVGDDWEFDKEHHWRVCNVYESQGEGDKCEEILNYGTHDWSAWEIVKETAT
ncbi:MAG: hypothetical protein J5755_02540, partial [Clostridia bacterium]|nr:hypothetical protein [Clostridia bacterium]